MPSADEIDLVTVDAFGTVLELVEPYERLREALVERGVERDRDAVAAAFSAEVAYYLPRSHHGRDDATLATLRRDCAAVFLGELEAGLDPGEFAPAFVAALEFRPKQGAERALEKLCGGGLVLACVTNWDISFAEHVARLELSRFFAEVVTSAEAGRAKPDPAVFELALGRVGVEPSRALHVGDQDADRDGARAAGFSFEPAPLATLPARLGL